MKGEIANLPVFGPFLLLSPVVKSRESLDGTLYLVDLPIGPLLLMLSSGFERLGTAKFQSPIGPFLCRF